MISWEEYIRHNITNFRERYKKLSRDVKKWIDSNKQISFLDPCQVVVINFKPYAKYIIVLHNEEYLDMEMLIFESIDVCYLINELEKNKDLQKWLGKEGAWDIAKSLVERRLIKDKEWDKDSIFSRRCFVLLFQHDPRSEHLHLLSDNIYDMIDFFSGRMFERKQRKKIKETVSGIRIDAKSIQVKELRTRIIQKTERLETQIGELDKKIDEQMSRLRQLIGTSEKFLDWKAFSSDVEHLKETHIAKETFKAHIERLDEKIDILKDNLNTRIEDLKAIKFWSKRTLLEIALAIMTVIATLYGAGVIKF